MSFHGEKKNYLLCTNEVEVIPFRPLYAQGALCKRNGSSS